MKEKKYIILGIALFLQLILINMIFGQVRFDTEDKNYETNQMLVNVFELLLMLIVNVGIIYNFLINDIDKLSLYFVIILTCVIILLYWFVYRTTLLGNYIRKVDYDIPNVEEPQTKIVQENNNSNNVKPVTGVSFSKYHDKNNNRDFSFENTYPNYNNIEPSLESTESNNSSPDYSMYNGYDPSNICYQCRCMEEEDGDKYCAKDIPGMGRIGCSERWECLNCKDCQSWDDDRFTQTEQDNSDKRYTCQDCKCLNTTAGKICGRVSRVDGFVQKCSSDCSRCDKCYGTKSGSSDSNNSNKFITVDPSSNLSKVIVNNIKNTDLNDILD